MNLLRPLAITIVIVLVAAASASTAQAGEYAVYACEPGAGDVNRSWFGEANHGGMTAYSVCPPGGETRSWNRGLVARHVVVPSNPNATIPTGAQSAVAFYAPPGTSLSRITYTHEFCSVNGYQSGLVDGAGRWHIYSWSGACASAFPAQGTVNLGGTNVVRLVALCRFGPCPVGGGALRAWATMRSATVVVADYSVPQVSMSVGGGWRRGVVDVNANASDNVGIRSADAWVGGKSASGHANGCDHTLPVPCPSLTRRLPVDTRIVPDGRHGITVRAQDAADNWSSTNGSILVDNTAPVAPLNLGIVGGSGWRQRNTFSVKAGRNVGHSRRSKSGPPSVLDLGRDAGPAKPARLGLLGLRVPFSRPWPGARGRGL